jgi:hypothetical protein
MREPLILDLINRYEKKVMNERRQGTNLGLRKIAAAHDHVPGESPRMMLEGCLGSGELSVEILADWVGKVFVGAPAEWTSAIVGTGEWCGANTPWNRRKRRSVKVCGKIARSAFELVQWSSIEQAFFGTDGRLRRGN